MSDNKKYYYLKIAENFFERDEMIMLESMPDGHMYSNILIKLYLRSLKNEGKLLFNNRIPYNPQMLSSVTRMPVAVVEKALNLFRELGLIELLDNGAIYMLDIQNFIGRSSTEADRIREYRKKINEEKKVTKKIEMKDKLRESGLISLKSGVNDTKEQMSYKCNDNCTPEIEIELDIDKELEIETEIDNVDDSVYNSNLKIISRLYQENIGVVNGLTAEWLIDLAKSIDTELFKRAISIANDKGKLSLGYVKGIIKQWLDRNITTLEQLEAHELQRRQKQDKTKKEDDEGYGDVIEKLGKENDENDGESEEEQRARLLREIEKLE